jgi:hypothetical protein
MRKGIISDTVRHKERVSDSCSICKEEKAETRRDFGGEPGGGVEKTRRKVEKLRMDEEEELRKKVHGKESLGTGDGRLHVKSAWGHCQESEVVKRASMKRARSRRESSTFFL